VGNPVVFLMLILRGENPKGIFNNKIYTLFKISMIFWLEFLGCSTWSFSVEHRGTLDVTTGMYVHNCVHGMGGLGHKRFCLGVWA
jgi:hypothetical protein